MQHERGARSSIHATSPLLGVGAGVAAAAGAPRLRCAAAWRRPRRGQRVAAAGAAAARLVAAPAPRACSCPARAPAPPKARRDERDELSSFFIVVFPSRVRRRRSRRCGCGRPARGRRRRSCRRRSCRCWRLFSIASMTLVEQVVLDRGLDLHLRQEVDDVLGAAVELGVALLAPEALDLGDGDALHADGRERFAHLVELERLDDGGDQFHDNPLARLRAGSQAMPRLWRRSERF